MEKRVRSQRRWDTAVEIFQTWHRFCERTTFVSLALAMEYIIMENVLSVSDDIEWVGWR